METPTRDQLLLENSNLKNQISKQEQKIKALNYEATLPLQDNPEDSRRSLFFAIKELKEVITGESSLEDKLRDLEIRHCKFLR